MSIEIKNLKAPKGWKLSSVGKTCNIHNNLRLPISSDERKHIEGEYPYYGPTGILGYIDHFRINGKYALIGEDGDHFLKSSKMPMTLLIDGKFNVNNHAHIISGGKDCTTEWFFQFFRHTDITPYLSRQGVGRYKLNKAALEKLPILVPPLPEQDKINQILYNWDSAITKTENLVIALLNRKKALMQRLLTGQVRFPGLESDWKEIQIGKLVEEVKRPIEWNDNAIYNLISVRRRSGGLFLREQRKGSEIKTKNMSVALAGDFLISKMQIVHGASGLTSHEFDGMHISGSYISLITRDPRILDIRFFDLISRLPSFYRLTYLSSYGVHIEKMTFNLKNFLKRKIYIPLSLEEQRKLINIFEVAEKEIKLEEKKLEALKQQKKGLMQKLLTGQIRVKV